MLSTHVLDTSSGQPAAKIAVMLFAVDGGVRTHVSSAVTNTDGRTDNPMAEILSPGMYELIFTVAPYFAARNIPAFYDEITIRFRVDDAIRKYHVPLLLAPWGYSTYRGS
jgi:5-hydroxyisourate hydrolase